MNFINAIRFNLAKRLFVAMIEIYHYIFVDIDNFYVDIHKNFVDVDEYCVLQCELKNDY